MNVDFVIGETCDYIEGAGIGLEGIEESEINMTRVINFTIHSCGGTLDSYSAEDACIKLAEMKVTVLCEKIFTKLQTQFTRGNAWLL